MVLDPKDKELRKGLEVLASLQVNCEASNESSLELQS